MPTSQSERYSDNTQVAAKVNNNLIEETPSNLSQCVQSQLQKARERSSITPSVDLDQDPRFELRSDLQSQSSNNSVVLDEFIDVQKMTFGKQQDHEPVMPPEKEMMKRANRTAQILL